ncbi:hypothetical protein Nepgr_013530 [Nepenthes gracilis]|uniref:Uncharacterized protein n=1 Tax=Nepenthes gracilis TaxID=150966 RepID=A0AAD3SJC1_NEPGR|nr:hypothetical protein Nepgr_013530 [Nepenthes gracilis]
MLLGLLGKGPPLLRQPEIQRRITMSRDHRNISREGLVPGEVEDLEGRLESRYKMAMGLIEINPNSFSAPQQNRAIAIGRRL